MKVIIVAVIFLLTLNACAVSVPVSFLNFNGAGKQSAQSGPAALFPPGGMLK